MHLVSYMRRSTKISYDTNAYESVDDGGLS